MRMDAEQRERLALDDVQVAGHERDRRAAHEAARVMPPGTGAPAALEVRSARHRLSDRDTEQRLESVWVARADSEREQDSVTSHIEMSTGPKFPALPANFLVRPGPARNQLQNYYSV